MPRLTYLSHSAFILENDEFTLLIDPFLTGNPLAKKSSDDIEKVDYIILSHGHGDHMGDTISIAKRTGATVIANFEIASYCDHQGVTAHPMHIGGGFNFPFGRVKLTIAHHGSALIEDGKIICLGNPAGLLIDFDGKMLHHAGDTALTYDMRLLKEYNIDVAILPVGDNFTMGIDDAVKAVEFIEPRVTIPMHYNTFGYIEVDINEFVEKMNAKGFTPKVLEVDESYNY